MSGDYKVGYGKPPLGTRFKKGQSGNPKGRRKGSKNLSTMLHEALEATVVVNINGRRRTVTKLEAAFTQQANRAAAGDQKALKLMADLMVAAQLRDATSDGEDQHSPAVRRDRDQQILAQLTARLLERKTGDGDNEK